MGGLKTDLATKMALLFIFIGFAIHIIGFGAPYWRVTEKTNEGLWQDCPSSNCNKIDTAVFATFRFDEWFQAVRTLECFGLMGSLAVLIFVGLYICVGCCEGRKCIAVFEVILCFATDVVILAAVIIYGSKKDCLNWAFGLTTGGGVCYFLAGIFVIASMRTK